MKLPYYLLLAAAVTPAIAQTPSAKSSLNYNRVAVGYSSDDIFKGYNVTGSALLGNSVIVSGIYDDVKTKGEAFGVPVSGLSGKLSGFGLAYKFNVGPGDLALGYSYKTGTVLGTFSEGTLKDQGGIASAEQKGFNLNYRLAINSSLEVSAGYSRMTTRLAAIAETAGPSPVIDESANIWNVGARYNFTRNIDLSLDYTFKNQNAGGNKMGVSVGYNF